MSKVAQLLKSAVRQLASDALVLIAAARILVFLEWCLLPEAQCLIAVLMSLRPVVVWSLAVHLWFLL